MSKPLSDHPVHLLCSLKAAANKLKAEMEEFGIPPNFPVTEAPVVKEEKSTESKVEQKGILISNFE